MRLPASASLSSCVLGLLAALTACEPKSAVPEPGAVVDDEPTSGSSSGGPGSDTAPAPEPDPSTGELPDDPGSSFIEEPDGGTGECDPFVQDCPAGHKCTYWANDGGSSWNSTRCVPIVPDAGAVGEPCTVEGNGTTGIDTCELGAMCWDVDPETNEGYCVELCSGSAELSYCTDPDTRCEGRDIRICLPTCCPVEQDCPEGQGCYPFNDVFECATDASKDMGGYGDPCEYINVCDPGLACLSAQAIPDCSGSSGCCTAFCNLGSTSCTLLDPLLECVAWYEEGAAPPGGEHIGACVLPQ